MTVIGLDAGHGTNTAGKGVAEMQEWEFNHEVARLAKPLLENNGFTVVLGQPLLGSDVDLASRTDYYKAKGARAIFSIHADANGDSYANGAWGFYWNTRSDSKRLADMWIKHLTEQGGIRARGNRPSVYGTWTNFHMTRVPDCPSVLMEHGFMTNAGDLKKLMSANYRLDAAIAVARTACEYFGKAYNGSEPPKAEGTVGDKVQPAPVTSAAGAKTQWDWSGRFTANTTIRVRRGLGMKAHLVPRNSYLFKDQWVDFDRLYIRDGYWWIRFRYPTNPAAGYFYMPVGHRRTNVGFVNANKGNALWGKVTGLKTSAKNTWPWSGRFTASTTIKVRRNTPSLKSPAVPRNSYIFEKQWVEFDQLYLREGYWWVRFKYPTNPSSGYFYMAVGRKSSGIGFESAAERGNLWGRLTNLKTD